MEYAPEDFNQSAINSGQRKINAALTKVDEKLIKALEALKAAIAASPTGHTFNLEAVQDAINEVYGISRRVADIKPPGCDTTWN
jgi:hypothetical protein